MAGEDFVAGSVWIQFKAAADAVVSAAAEVDAALAGVAKDATRSATVINTAGRQMSAAFTTTSDAASVYLGRVTRVSTDAVSRLQFLRAGAGAAMAGFTGTMQKAGQAVDAVGEYSSRSYAKIGKFTSRMIGLQLGMMTLTGALEDKHGGLGYALTAVQKGFSSFAMTAMIMPGPVGLAIASIVGLTTALASLTGKTKDEEEAEARLAKKTKDVKDDYQNLADDLVKIAQDYQTKGFIGQLLGDDLNKIKVDKAVAEIERLSQAINKVNEGVALINDQIAVLQGKVPGERRAQVQSVAGAWAPTNLIEHGPTESEQNIVKLENDKYIAQERASSLESARLRIAKELADELERQRQAAADVAQSDAWDLQTERDSQRIIQQALADREAIDKSAAGMEVFDRAEKVDMALEDINRKLYDGSAALTEWVTKWAKIAEQNKLAKADLDAGEKAMAEELAYIDQMDHEFREAQKKTTEENAKAFSESFAKPFSEAIGQGLRDGILSGQSAMETLAKVGENLFSNAIDTWMKNLQTGMTDALGSIFGNLGGAMGDLFSGVLGIAGYFMSRKGRGSSSASYASTSGVTGTESTRGIVAGPGSVAIAAVGDNLSRAMYPVITRLDVLIGIARTISTRSASGASYAGSVPTS